MPDLTYAVEQQWTAPCGCPSTLWHRPSCRLVHGAAARREVSDQLHCDTEDGCVWVHLGDVVASLTPKAARNFGDELHVCAHTAEHAE